MAHVRQQIREAIGTALAGLPTTGTRVYQSRLWPLQETDLPAILISTGEEQKAIATVGSPAILQRTLSINVDLVAIAVVDLDDLLDQICLEVEVALAGPIAAFASVGTDTTLTPVSIGEPELLEHADKPRGRARMRYDVTYFCTESAPDVAL